MDRVLLAILFLIISVTCVLSLYFVMKIIVSIMSAPVISYGG